MFIFKITKYVHGKLNGLRLKWTLLSLKARGIECGVDVYIGDRVNIQLGLDAKLKLGDRVTILDYCNIFVNTGAVVEIGDDTFISHHCEIASSESINIGNKCAFAAYCTVIDTDKEYTDILTSMPFRKGLTSPINIEDNVWLAYKATVLRGVTIAMGSVIGANAVVTKNIPSSCVAVGLPAKVIKRF
jgi:acetyltransferase-like isoleucine patch superfamily enzyme